MDQSGIILNFVAIIAKKWVYSAQSKHVNNILSKMTYKKIKNTDPGLPSTDHDDQRFQRIGPETQAERVLRKFGGARRLSDALKAVDRYRNVATIYRWTYSRSIGGAGGLIPSSGLRDVMLAARHAGIILTADDMDPRVK